MNSTGSGIVTALNCAYGLLILNNTIVGNRTSAVAGITIAGYGGCTRIVNNIIVGNPAITGDGVPPLLQNNNIFAWSGAAYGGFTNQTGINGNISADPYFACEPSKEFRILAGSPCIDAGTSNGVALPLTDFDGQPRFVNGQTNGAGVVDIGAFEFNPSRPPEPCLFLDCPTNMILILPAGQETGVVNYPTPYATPVATVTTSPNSGSVFPAADNLVSVVAVYGTNSLNCNFLIRLFRTIDFARALNLTNMDWLTSGDTSWFVQSNITHSGFLALRSGTINSNQTSTLQTTLTGPGTLIFWWKVSSEANHDLLSLKVNSSTQAVISGEVDWQSRTLYAGSGAQVLQWTYAKDAVGSTGQDAAWLDQVAWTPGAVGPSITIQPASISAGVGMNPVFSVTAVGTPPLTYQWLFNGQSVPGAVGSSLVITNVQATNVGTYSVQVMNQVGTNFSTNATLALTQVLAWGANSYGQTNVPVGLTNVAAVAGGWHHSVVLRTDGTVTAWGANNRGQTNVSPGLSNVLAIASRSGDFSLALRADGTVVGWGQIGAPAGLSNVVAIAADGYRALALKADGTAVAWGSGTVPQGLSNVVAISAGDSANLFLKADGKVVGSGTAPPVGLSNVVAIAAGGGHYLALKADETVTAWGYNANGQATVPAGLSNVVAIAAGDYHSLALKRDGTAIAWGQYYDGSIYLPATVLVGLTNVEAITAGSDHDLALLGNGGPSLQATLNEPRWIGSQFSVSTPAQSGRVYRLEYKDSLADATWVGLPLVAGNGAGITLVDSTAMGAQRFYRVRWW